jgi:hypothetical protein
MATIKMQKGDILADIFDSPETIAQARRDGYSLVDPADIGKLGDDLTLLTKNELLELARQKGITEKSLGLRKKSEIIEQIKAADTEPPKDETGSPAAETGKPETASPETKQENNTAAEQESGKTEPETKKRGFFG